MELIGLNALERIVIGNGCFTTAGYDAVKDSKNPNRRFCLKDCEQLKELKIGNMAFMLSTITRSGNGTAVFMIIIGIALMFLGKPDSFWNVLLNPFRVPDNVHPIIWEGILIKNRIFLLSASLVWMMVGLLYLQKREKFV